MLSSIKIVLNMNHNSLQSGVKEMGDCKAYFIYKFKARRTKIKPH